MRKRIQFWPSESPSVADPMVQCCTPEAYESYDIVPDDAWEEYEVAYNTYREALKKLVSRVLPAEPLNQEEISALKHEILKMTVDSYYDTFMGWRRDLGMSALAPKVYGEEFVAKYGIPYEKWKEYRAIRQDDDGLLCDGWQGTENRTED